MSSEILLKNSARDYLLQKVDITLETSGEDRNIHSKRVEKMEIYNRNGWRRWKSKLETSGEDGNLHSKRVERMEIYTRNEWERSVR